MSDMEPYSADAAKRRKRRENDDLSNSDDSLLAEEIIKEGLSLITRSIDCDADSYDFCIKLLGEAVRVYKKIGYIFEVDLLHGYIRDLTAVMNYSKTQEKRETEAYELLKQGASEKALKVLEELQR